MAINPLFFPPTIEAGKDLQGHLGDLPEGPTYDLPHEVGHSIQTWPAAISDRTCCRREKV